MINVHELIGDPLFQLNLCLWMGQPFPSMISTPINPLLYKYGFKIKSIGANLALSPDIILQANKAGIEIQQAARPDIIFESEDKGRIALFECKRSSFSTTSSNTLQAKTFMLMTGKVLVDSLAIDPSVKIDNALFYMTRDEKKEGLKKTLEILNRELCKTKLDAAATYCIGIRDDEANIYITFNNKTKEFLNIGERSPAVVIELEEETDPRPLYFIPYDPSVNHKETEEEEFCLRILNEKFLQQILSIIGRSSIPCDEKIKSSDILNEITFGLYEYWDDSDSKKNMRKKLRGFIKKLRDLLDEQDRECIIAEPGEWHIIIKTHDIQERIIEKFSKAKIGPLSILDMADELPLEFD